MKRALAAVVVLALLAFSAWWFGPRRAKPYVEHTVVAGDTLSKLAKRYDVTVAELREWNGIEGDLIQVDQVLRVNIEPPEQLAEVATPAASRRRRSTSSEGTPKRDHGLSMPGPETCVKLDTAIGEQGMVASAGLDHEQVKGALDVILPHALGCEPDDGVSSLSMNFEILVGCDGLVDDVDVLDGDMASESYLACVVDVLEYADFPAHDLPDGMRFTYPVTANW